MLKLKELRNEAQITQRQLAEALNVKPNTVNQWENGKRQLGASILPRLAELLNCSVDELLGVKKP